jgi:hypothetical protein
VINASFRTQNDMTRSELKSAPAHILNAEATSMIMATKRKPTALDHLPSPMSCPSRTKLDGDAGRVAYERRHTKRAMPSEIKMRLSNSHF